MTRKRTGGWPTADPRGGSERGDEPERCCNTSVLFGPDGSELATYRKIHLFDVDVSPEVRFQESVTVEPGEDTVVASTELGRLGLTVCYDLRWRSTSNRWSGSAGPYR